MFFGLVNTSNTRTFKDTMKTNVDAILILCAIVAIANAAPTTSSGENSALKERDFDCSAKRSFFAKRQCPGQDTGSCKYSFCFFHVCHWFHLISRFDSIGRRAPELNAGCRNVECGQ